MRKIENALIPVYKNDDILFIKPCDPEHAEIVNKCVEQLKKRPQRLNDFLNTRKAAGAIFTALSFNAAEVLAGTTGVFIDFDKHSDNLVLFVKTDNLNDSNHSSYEKDKNILEIHLIFPHIMDVHGDELEGVYEKFYNIYKNNNKLVYKKFSQINIDDLFI